MVRRARFTIEDGIYHVLMRGNNRNNIFHEHEDYKFFLKDLKGNKYKYKLKIYHYALMKNHIHMIIMSKNGKLLADAIKRLSVIYTKYYRKKYGGIGHFFQDRFKSILIQKGRYLLECGRYIELNPVKAGIVKSPEDYLWSSYKKYICEDKDNLVDISPEYEGLSENKLERVQMYKDYVNSKRNMNVNDEKFLKDDVYGSKKYKKELRKG